MVVASRELARELRRRRVGRNNLLAALEEVHPARSTWVPADLRTVPTSLLVLAALSLTTPPPAG